MTEKLQIFCGPADRSGRRVVIANHDGSERHRDRFNTDSDYHRRKFREAVVEKLSLPDQAHEWLEQRIIQAADSEDLRTDDNTLVTSQPILVSMADIDPRPIRWLWPQRIPLGRITLLVGMPGVGKSFFTCDMASRISTGTPWPDGTESPQGSVIFVSCEDDPHDTIRPRLDAHRADVSRICMLASVKQSDDEGQESEVIFTLEDSDALELALQQIEDCKLIVVDPIGSFLGGRTDAHRDNEVRAVLAPIAMLAEKYGPAVLVVAHRRKAGGAIADDMALGSRAFTGIARSVWHLSRDNEDKSRRLLLPGKSNLAAEQTGMAFTIAGEPAAVSWEREPIAMTADEALALEGKASGKSSALEEAVSWLKLYLAEGCKPGQEVKEAAERDGIAIRTLERAKKELEVVCGPDGFGGPWVWKLPDVPSLRQDFPEFANEKTLAESVTLGGLCTGTLDMGDTVF